MQMTKSGAMRVDGHLSLSQSTLTSDGKAAADMLQGRL